MRPSPAPSPRRAPAALWFGPALALGLAAAVAGAPAEARPAAGQLAGDQEVLAAGEPSAAGEFSAGRRAAVGLASAPLQAPTPWPRIGLRGGPVYGLVTMPLSKPAAGIEDKQQWVAGGELVLTSARGLDWTQRPGTGPVDGVLAAPDGVILASTKDGRALRTTNFGGRWDVERVRENAPARFLAVSPNYANDGLALAVTTEDWRLYRSDRNTREWVEVLVRPGERHENGAVGISPEFASDEQMWLGTEAGIYHSTNAGQTWSLRAAAGPSVPRFGREAGPAQGIVVPGDFGNDPDNDYDVLNDDLFAFNGDGLFRSDDAGATWRRLPLQVAQVWSLAVSNAWPVDPVLVAAVAQPGAVAAVSQDGGASWRMVAGPPGVAGRGVAMAVDFGAPGFQVPERPGFLPRAFLPILAQRALDRTDYPLPYRGTRELALATDGDGVWRSRDAGQTWDKEGPNASLINVQPSALVHLGGAAGEALAGTDAAGLYQSADGGQTWSRRDTELPRGAGQVIHQLVASPALASDGTLYAGSSGGVWVSRDRGRSWSALGGPAPADTLALSPAFARDRTLMAAGRMSSDGGQTWLPVPGADFPWAAVAFSARFETDRTIWLARRVGAEEDIEFSLYRSTDAGQSWAEVRATELRDRRIAGIASVAVAADPLRVVLATGSGVYISQDEGASWRRPPSAPAADVRAVSSRVMLQPFARAVIAVATRDGFAWSTNRGLDWTASPRGQGEGRALSLSDEGAALLGAIPVALTRSDELGGAGWAGDAAWAR